MADRPPLPPLPDDVAREPVSRDGVPLDASPVEYHPDPPQPRTRDRVWLHVLLLLLTVVTTTIVGAGHYQGFLLDFVPRPLVFTTWRDLVLGGLWYSGSILAILGCHEMGHYLACRHYRVDASLPFFLPFPSALTGTLGAFIRIRSPIRTKPMDHHY